MRVAFTPLLVFVSSLSAQSIGNCPVFPADSIWNTPVDQLPLHPSSSTWINTIGPSIGLHPDFGAGIWNGAPIGIPFITVPGTQTKYPATFTYADESDPGPYAVPLNAPIEGGSASSGDRHAISIDVDNCILYELYAAYPQSASWQAGSGAIFDLKSNALRPATWTSADAAGLPIWPGLLRYDEIVAGEIRHAIRFTVPATQKLYLWPARHYASSSTDPTRPPMGARFRLRANFDISGFSPTNQIILRALKKYGMMIADNGSAWYLAGAPDSRWNDSDLHLLNGVHGSDFEVVDVSGLMISADSGQARQTTSGVSVSVSPLHPSVQVSTQKQFMASVSGSSNQAVTWTVSGGGTIDSTGLYTAPAALPSPATATVTATSVADPTAAASTTVTITAPSTPVSITISPTSASVRIKTTKTFTATVQNTTNTGVIWEVNGIVGGNSTVGTISSLGTYRAPNSVPSPNTVQVSAVSKADTSKSASATVTITRR